MNKKHHIYCMTLVQTTVFFVEKKNGGELF